MAEDRGSFSPAERQALADAIRSAEARTAGEIVCVVARASGDYFLPAAALLLALLLPAGVITALLLDRFWLTLSLPVFALAQLLAGATLLVLLWLSPLLALLLSPRRLRAEAVHAAALGQFLARDAHRTRGRTGVLIFVSRLERQVEVLADEAIHARVPEGTWDGVVSRILAAAREGRLAIGLASAVTEAGDLLAAPFPPGAENPNEVPDHLIEI